MLELHELTNSSETEAMILSLQATKEQLAMLAYRIQMAPVVRRFESMDKVHLPQAVQAMIV